MENNLVYDLGMHTGEDTAFYLACGFRVIAVEADPDLVAAASRRFQAEIEAQKLVILNVGIARQSARAEFWINEVSSHFNSFNREMTARFGHPHHSVSINCRRLDEIISEYGVPFYLKIDLEGNDIVCCDQLSPATKAKYISVEMSQMELLVRLRELGYDRFKLIRQTDFQAADPREIPLHLHALRWLHRKANTCPEDRKLSMRIRRGMPAWSLRLANFLGFHPWPLTPPFRSKILPDWNFVAGSSGTFGEDWPSPWLGWEQMAHLWQRDLREHEKMGLEYWCDLHATTSTPR